MKITVRCSTYTVTRLLLSLWTGALCLQAQVETKLTANGAAAGDQFGYSAAMDDDRAAVGARLDDSAAFNSGAVYVLQRNGSGWAEQAKLTASDQAAGDFFGGAVAIGGDRLAVGAFRDDHSGLTDPGSAYVFRHDGTAWGQEAKLAASDSGSGDFFGTSIAIDGDRVIVGAPFHDHSGLVDSGAAYVFKLDGTSWIQEAKLVAADPGTDDWFGNSVAIVGDLAIVGAPRDEHSGVAGAGSVYVFKLNGTSWSQDTKLISTNPSAARFGHSVAFDGQRILAGAFAETPSGSLPSAGAGYVFQFDGVVWSQQARLSAADAAANDNFGVAVAIDGPRAIVGALGNDALGISNAGAAYAFQLDGGVWTQQAKLTASDAATGDQFGNAVAVSGARALIGAAVDDHSSLADAGSAYVFDFDSEGPEVTGVTAAPAVAEVSKPVGGVTLTATVDETNTGGSAITAAEYSIDGGAFAPMSSVDGAFDEASEEVTAQVGPFAVPGVYEVCVVATDAAGNMGGDEGDCVLLPVYDPNGGFVTGGGAVQSPASADLANGVSGTARFGFVSKYLPGQSAPDGNLEFRFKDGDIRFQSTSMDWLVVTGQPRAIFRGDGELNAATSCKFEVDAWDGSFTGGQDAFGLKVFACGAGVDRYALDPTPLVNGNIKIHH